MNRRHYIFGGSVLGVAFLVVAIVRLLVGNGVLWHYLRW